jgi:hypothetical protein
MRVAMLLGTLVLMFVAIGSAAWAEIIYYDDFDGPSGVDLNGTMPDITTGNATWQAGQYVDADGTLCDSVAGNMFTAALPFTPSIGKIYELSVTVDNNGDWVGIGFLSGISLETRILDNSPMLWALVRGSGSGARDQAFVGPGTAGGLGNATTSSADEMMVRVETISATEWVVTWYFDGSKEFQQSVDPSAFNIQYVAFGSNGYWTGVSGTISSFKLEDISQSTVAWDPSPADGAEDLPRRLTLSWNPGIYADKHDVYLGTNFDKVNEADRTEHSGLVYYSENHDANNYVVTGLAPGTTYYWRVDEVNEAHPAQSWRGDIWSFTVIPPTASNPAPSNGAIFVSPDVGLSWTPGPIADKHNVYFGTNFDDVNDATKAEHANLLYYSESQDANYYPLDGTLALDYGQTYFWRVDEVNDTNIWKGDVWRFVTKEFDGGVLLGDWEQRMDGWGIWSGTTSYSSTDGVTMGNHSLRQEIAPGWGYMLLLPLAEVPGGVDAFFANNILSLDITRLASEWSNDGTSGIFMVIIADGDEWHDFGQPANSTWSPADGDRTMTLTWNYSDALTLVNPNPSYLDIMICQDCESFTTGGIYYFDNARFSTPVLASNANPTDGATEVKRESTLSWTSGRYAVSHDVYFGSDFDIVNDANRNSDPFGVLVSQNQTGNNYKPGILDFNTTYYWRIDEVNEPNIWKGWVWSFTTGNYLVVDDFEDYNDYQPDRIFDTWIDGWGVPENGSQVGYASPTFVEQSIVQDGSQSMPFFYDNTNGVVYSEAVRTFDNPQDWTENDTETLRLFFRGYPKAFVEDPLGTYTISASGADVWGENDEFRYAYKVLSGNGSITAQVVSVENTNDWAKAGVMIRETLDDYSTNGFMFATANGRRAFQNRPIAPGSTFSAYSGAGAITLPLLVKLVRQDNNITAYYSEDGINWIQQPDDENTGDDASSNPQNIVMQQDIYIGLAYCSHNANVVGTAVFSDVTTTGNVTGADWQVKAIGTEMGDNDAQSLYIAVEGGGTVKVIEHPDNPNAVLAADWQQWDIPLSVLSDAGVNLLEVQKMTIGVEQTDGQPGAGKLYFDEIRLYPPPENEEYPIGE